MPRFSITKGPNADNVVALTKNDGDGVTAIEVTKNPGNETVTFQKNASTKVRIVKAGGAGAIGGEVVFFDTFTEGSDTNLESHTPDTGTAWTRSGGNAGDVIIQATTDNVYSAAYTTDSVYYSDDLGNADHYAEVYKEAGSNLSGITIYVCLRIDATNNWAAGLELNNSGEWRIIRNISGTKTIPTADSGTLDSTFVAGDGFRLEFSGNTLIVSKDTGAGFVEQGRATITHNNTVTTQGIMHGANRTRTLYTSYKAGLT